MNRYMLSRTHVKVRPGAVMHTDIAELNVLSIYVARYFFSLIDEVSGPVRDFYRSSKAKAAELQNRQAFWVEQESGSVVKNTVLYVRIECTKDSDYFKANRIEAYDTSRYTPLENMKAGKMSRTVKYGLQTLLIEACAMPCAQP